MIKNIIELPALITEVMHVTKAVKTQLTTWYTLMGLNMQYTGVNNMKSVLLIELMNIKYLLSYCMHVAKVIRQHCSKYNNFKKNHNNKVTGLLFIAQTFYIQNKVYLQNKQPLIMYN